MIIEYGNMKGLEGLVVVVKNKGKIKAVHPFLCDKMDVDFCLNYVIAKWGDPESIKKTNLSYLKKIDFDDLDLTLLTSFSKRVYHKLYMTKAGDLLSYSDLAAKAGNSKAARVVGSLMRKNYFPIIVPCHRVHAKSGAEHFSINCFHKRPSACAKKKGASLRECAKRIKLALRDFEIE
jgi:O-6-methylguanine DNA methyltransferase